ncbi:MAG: hypothetical protein ACRD0O_06640 [Acidimicrobiia bacterium]
MVSAEAVRRGDERLGWTTTPFPYLVRIVELPPLVVQAAFEASRRARSHPGGPGTWDIGAGAGRLELSGDGRSRAPVPARYWAYRAVGGAIRSRWHAPIPVLVELVPWSRTRSALGLSLRRRPLIGGEGLYLAVGAEALEALGAEIEAWGLRDLHELEGWLGDLSREEPAG